MSKSSLTQIIVPADEGNYTKGRSGRSIEAITIHHMAGRLTAEQCGRIFQAKGRYGSSHYGVGYDGSIANYVDEEDTAWTNSNWDSNCKSVTIETSDNDNSWYVNDITLNALIKLVADIAKRRGLGTLVPGKNLTWHSMFTSTTCPGDYLRSKMQYIADEANKINNENISNEVNVYYRVKTQKHGWLKEVKNLEDYAGWENSPITGLAIRVNKGSIKYRVHIKGRGWLPYVTGYDINDFNNGFAGDGVNAIDCVECYYYTPNNIRPYQYAYYKVNDYPYQKDLVKGNGFDGFAGVSGVTATKFQMYIGN
jgi:hypothetical protein